MAKIGHIAVNDIQPTKTPNWAFFTIIIIKHLLSTF